MIRNKLIRMYRDARAFHEDESGESSVMSNVMLLAVAALAVIALIAFGKTAMKWLSDTWKTITGSSMESE